jgi:salicylate hydroxylase
MAIEDAAALGILFSKKYFRGDIEESLSAYNTVRLPRVTRVQSAAARAALNINERIGNLLSVTPKRACGGITVFKANTLILILTGFSNNSDMATYKVDDEKAKLTIEEMNA